ncbi:MAG TPA: hypothetical protein VHP33_28045 [Polyangiaceae bacterium]|nr:hypothetical protein [Polyangiaceae bacterium]
MAAKKKAKSKSKVAKKAKATGKKVVKKAKATGKRIAKTLLGRIAQVSAQLVLDSGVLGAPPKRASAKKRARKA